MCFFLWLLPVFKANLGGCYCLHVSACWGGSKVRDCTHVRFKRSSSCCSRKHPSLFLSVGCRRWTAGWNLSALVVWTRAHVCAIIIGRLSSVAVPECALSLGAFGAQWPKGWQSKPSSIPGVLEQDTHPDISPNGTGSTLLGNGHWLVYKFESEWVVLFSAECIVASDRAKKKDNSFGFWLLSAVISPNSN